MSDSNWRSDRLGLEQRAADRFLTELPVEVGGGSVGWMRDVSATGVYFQTNESKEVGSIVNLMLEITISGQRLSLVCEGEVVRVDDCNAGKVGVAARLRTSFFSEGRKAALGQTVPAALEN